MRQGTVPLHVSPSFPPSFVSAGNDDPLLPHTRGLVEALEQHGVDHDVLLFADDHEPVPRARVPVRPRRRRRARGAGPRCRLRAPRRRLRSRPNVASRRLGGGQRGRSTVGATWGEWVGHLTGEGSCRQGKQALSPLARSSMPDTAVVTGAARGIGRAIATRLAREGWQVVVADLDAAELARRRRRARRPRRPGRHVDRRRACATSSTRHTPTSGTSTSSSPTRASARSRVSTPPTPSGQRALDTNVLAHVRAARHLVPRWLDAGGGPPRRHRLGGRAADDARRRALLRQQARRRRLRRVAERDLPPPRHRRPGDLPAGRADADARGVRPAPGRC